MCPPTIIVRHRKENLAKCSLRGLESRSDMLFFSYPLKEQLPDVSSYIVLAIDAEPISEADHDCGLFLIDATWRYAEAMARNIEGIDRLQLRSLPPHYRTAYPRRQNGCPDPERGLASLEALYIAYHLMGRETAGLLDSYYWKEQFLQLNGFGDKIDYP